MNRTRKLIALTTLALSLAACDFVGDGNDRDHATIGGNAVPDTLHCEEDEVIGFVQSGTPPYALGCIHIDILR